MTPPPAPALLHVAPLTRDAFLPYGDVIHAADRTHRAINQGTTLRYDVAPPDLTAQHGNACLSVFHASACAFPLTVRLLERHRLGTQSFIPLDGAMFIAIVALGGPQPDPATLAAFLVDGNQGITLWRDTWHHPLVSLREADFVVLERKAPTVDCELSELPAAAQRLLAFPD